MQPLRSLLRGFSLLVSTQFVQHVTLAGKCTVSTSSVVGTTSVCDYAPQDLYVTDASQTQFPVGYRTCMGIGESSVEADTACGSCACREKVIAYVGGKRVTWAVCIDAEDATTCVASEAVTREFCGSSFSAAVSIDSAVSSTTPNPTEAWPASSESPAVEEDNVIDASVPETSLTPSPEPTDFGDGASIIRPSDKSSADELGANSLASGSSFSSKQLTALVAVGCGIAVVAAIAVFVAIRKGRAEDKELRIPTEDCSRNDSALGSLGRPSTHHFTGPRGTQRYNPHRHNSATFNGSGFISSAASVSNDNVPFASIVVIGGDDDLRQQPGGSAFPSTQRRQASSKVRRQPPYSSAASFEAPTKAQTCLSPAKVANERRHATNTEAVVACAAARRTQGVSTASEASSRCERVFSSSSTGFSFSFDSTGFADTDTRDTAASEHLRESEDDFAFTTSSRAPPVIYETCMSDALASTDAGSTLTPLEPTTSSEASPRQNQIFDTSNTVISFSSSMYGDDRDTTRMYESEDDLMRSNSSCIAISFDESSFPRRSGLKG